MLVHQLMFPLLFRTYEHPSRSHFFARTLVDDPTLLIMKVAHLQDRLLGKTGSLREAFNTEIKSQMDAFSFISFVANVIQPSFLTESADQKLVLEEFKILSRELQLFFPEHWLFSSPFQGHSLHHVLDCRLRMLKDPALRNSGRLILLSLQGRAGKQVTPKEFLAPALHFLKKTAFGLEIITLMRHYLVQYVDSYLAEIVDYALHHYEGKTLQYVLKMITVISAHLRTPALCANAQLACAVRLLAERELRNFSYFLTPLSEIWSA